MTFLPIACSRLARAGFGFALLTLAITSPLRSQSSNEDLAAARSFYFREIFGPHSYLPGKNSFLLQNLHHGDRKTLLELHGPGSIRHIWSTWSVPGDSSDIPAPGRVRLRIFVDGEEVPSISGPLDELFKAAEATGPKYVPLPAFNYKGAFNIYLPIFFSRGVRVEMEAAGDLDEFYTQIDYRTQAEPESANRLRSENSAHGPTLNYTGDASQWTAKTQAHGSASKTASLNYSSAPAQLTIRGPAILRELRIRGSSLSDLEVEIYWDGEKLPSIRAPLKYLFSDFNNAAMVSAPNESTLFLPMPFRKSARILLRSLSGSSGRVELAYSVQSSNPPAHLPYLHAQYSETASTNGYEQFPVLRVKGAGLFVGMNLFDSGHNHGGGDAALIDAGSPHPLVLHGICGEDYFSFAWHKTGTMTPLTGAPAHERRYRLHLENPYPFHQSLQFLFGVFAGQHPKSVVFWYQSPNFTPTPWRTFDVPWKILGPADEQASLPDTPSDDSLQTSATINAPTPMTERWQDAEMHAGFLDATYQFRHYAMPERGTGFVAGRSQSKLVTNVHSPTARTVRTIFGHDDQMSVRVNNGAAAELPAQKGFSGTVTMLKLRKGWNKLVVMLHNDENNNWRWNGLSWAFESANSSDLKFSADPPIATTEP